jgi:hypothetical protein
MLFLLRRRKLQKRGFSKAVIESGEFSGALPVPVLGWLISVAHLNNDIYSYFWALNESKGSLLPLSDIYTESSLPLYLCPAFVRILVAGSIFILRLTQLINRTGESHWNNVFWTTYPT